MDFLTKWFSSSVEYVDVVHGTTDLYPLSTQALWEEAVRDLNRRAYSHPQCFKVMESGYTLAEELFVEAIKVYMKETYNLPMSNQDVQSIIERAWLPTHLYFSNLAKLLNEFVQEYE